MLAFVTRRPIAQQGTADDLVTRLGRFVDARRPGWSGRVRGASPAEIAELEAVAGLAAAGLRLPPSYRATLAFLGHDDGGLLASMQYRYGATRSISQLIDLHRELADEHDDACQPIILGSELGVYLAFELRRVDAHGESPVVGEGSSDVFAASWERLLFQHATLDGDHLEAEASWWGSVSPNRLAEALRIDGAASVAEVLAAVAVEHGLAPAWFGDDGHQYLARDEVAAWISTIHGLSFTVTGDAAPARTLAEALSRRFATGPLRSDFR